MENANAIEHSPEQHLSSESEGPVSGNSPLQAAANDSSQVSQLKQLQSAANQSPQVAVQRQRQEAVTQRMQSSSQAPMQLMKKRKTTAKSKAAVVAQERANRVELNASSMGHNYAYNLDQPDLITRSKGNTHSEPELMALSMGRQVRTDDNSEMRILTERAPCGYCEGDIQQIERESGKEVSVEYFVEYHADNPEKDKTDLWALYSRHNLTDTAKSDPAAAGLAQQQVTVNQVTGAAASAIVALLAASRKASGRLNFTGMQKNYAINENQPDLITHSKANGHSEPQLLGATLSRMQAQGDEADTITILTERAPCGRCASDIQNIANESGKSIVVHYLVNYDPDNDVQGQDDLWKVYRDLGHGAPKRGGGGTGGGGKRRR